MRHDHITGRLKCNDADSSRLPHVQHAFPGPHFFHEIKLESSGNKEARTRTLKTRLTANAVVISVMWSIPLTSHFT
jgi:hypothetical protein